MKKEFVTYEIALELKELGFDEPCFGYYGISRVPQTEGEIMLEERQVSMTGNLAEKICLAPTYSQAFRWFRDKYELFHSIIYQDDNSGPGGFDYEILNKRGKSQEDDEYLEFDTYEEAELDCLKKLIEIVKNK